METIAECVENEATLQLLAELGIDYAQGHHIARPAPAPVEVDRPLIRPAVSKPARSRRTA
jgi:EAL domain-containing protein (putative c-di-GMP-specific phosphodiesterase class I)